MATHSTWGSVGGLSGRAVSHSSGLRASGRRSRGGGGSVGRGRPARGRSARDVRAGPRGPSTRSPSPIHATGSGRRGSRTGGNVPMRGSGPGGGPRRGSGAPSGAGTGPGGMARRSRAGAGTTAEVGAGVRPGAGGTRPRVRPLPRALGGGAMDSWWSSNEPSTGEAGAGAGAGAATTSSATPPPSDAGGSSTSQDAARGGRSSSRDLAQQQPTAASGSHSQRSLARDGIRVLHGATSRSPAAAPSTRTQGMRRGRPNSRNRLRPASRTDSSTPSRGPPPRPKRQHIDPATAALGKTAAMNAVALQDHLMRAMNLNLNLGSGLRSTPGRSGRKKVKRRAIKSVDRLQQRIEAQRHQLRESSRAHRRAPSDIEKLPDLDFSAEDWICSKCTLLNAGTSTTCTACGGGRVGVEGDTRPVTLAQMRGLVQGPAPKLSQQEWAAIAKKTDERKDSDGDCAICMEVFGLGEQVLLSCSHVFHKACLESFERFAQSSERTCPLCRQANYQKKKTHVGAKRHRQRSAAQIQSLFRGFAARKRFLKLRRELYAAGGGDDVRRRDFYASRLSEVGTQLETAAKKRGDALDRLFAQLDKEVTKSRNILDAHARVFAEKAGPDELGVMPGPGPALTVDDWAGVEASAIVRGTDDCPICIQSMSDKARERVLLSCSHVFHLRCIQAFESFNVFERPQCPVCRAEYRKRVL